MIPYIFILVAAGAAGIGLCEFSPSKKRDYLYVIIITVLMCAMAICRGETVGADYDWIYRDIFEQVNNNANIGFIFSSQNPYRSEFIFSLLNLAVALVSDSPMVFFAVAAVITIVLRSVFILKYSSKVWISLFLYIGLGFFSYSLCTLRQELAISVAMFALPYLLDRKPIPYFAIIIFSGFIHNSLFMLIPLYFLVLIPPTKKWAIGLYSAGLLFIILFSGTLIDYFTTLFPRFDFYNSSRPGAIFLRGRSLNTILIWATLLILCALFYKRLIERNSKNMMLFNLYLFGALVMVLTVKTFIFQRVALMLLPFSIMLFAELFSALDYRNSALETTDKKVLPNKRIELKKKVADDKRFYYSIMALLIFFVVIEYFFLLNANRLKLVPYVTFWM